MEVKLLPRSTRDATWPWCPPTLWWCAWRINAAFTNSWNVFRSALLCQLARTLSQWEEKYWCSFMEKNFRGAELNTSQKNHNPLHTKVMKDTIIPCLKVIIDGLNLSNNIGLTLMDIKMQTQWWNGFLLDVYFSAYHFLIHVNTILLFKIFLYISLNQKSLFSF